MKAKTRLAIHAIRSAKFSFWKNTPRLRTANSHKGRKMVASEVNGSLYKGILKLAYLHA
jgi:hypothetical protein